MNSQNAPRRNLFWFLGTGLSLVVLGVLWGFMNRNQPGAPGVTQTALVSPTAAISPTTAGYPGASEVVATADLAATQSFVATVGALKNADSTQAMIEFTTSPQPTQVPVATGIYTDTRTAFQWRQFGIEVENAWVGSVGGRIVTVWAGALVSDPSQGVVQVIYEYPGQPISPFFLTADKHGSVHVASEQNNRLVLISTDGTTYYFDAPGLAFASSINEPIPTATPPATYTPIVIPAYTSQPVAPYPGPQPTAQATVAAP